MSNDRIPMLFGTPGIDTSKKAQARRLSRMVREDRLMYRVIERTKRNPGKGKNPETMKEWI